MNFCILRGCLDEYATNVEKEIDFFKKMGINITIIKDGSNDN